MSGTRITNADLEGRAATLTRLFRRVGIIPMVDHVVVDSGNGGFRLDITGDTSELRELYGADHTQWPAGWSGHRVPYNFPSGHGTRRELYNAATVAIGTLYEVITALNIAPLASTPGELALQSPRDSITSEATS